MTTPANITVVGLGAMGGGMARALCTSTPTTPGVVGTVTGYDRNERVVHEFYQAAVAAGKQPATMTAPPGTLRAAMGKETHFVLLALLNEAQCEQVCFGSGNGSGGGDDEEDTLCSLLATGSCVICTSTVSASWSRTAHQRFHATKGGIYFVDCPMSGGPVRARQGALTMMASGTPASLTRAQPILDLLGTDIYIIAGGPGKGSTVKMVHQLLAGVHICAAAESLALAACVQQPHLQIDQVYALINSAAGASWMFEDRGTRMIRNEDNVVKSSLDIFVKDLDIVYAEAKALQCPIPIASAVLQQFIAGQSLGFGKHDDSSIIHVYTNSTNKPIIASSSAPNGVGTNDDDDDVSNNNNGTNSTTTNTANHSVTVIGLGAMGGGMARALLNSSSSPSVVDVVRGYDMNTQLVQEFYQESVTKEKQGEYTAPPQSLHDAIMVNKNTTNTNFVILALLNEAQCEQVCFGGTDHDNLSTHLSPGACVISTSTVTATWSRKASRQFQNKGVFFVDCPMSGGPARAIEGKLTMMPSGTTESLTIAKPIIDTVGSDIYIIQGGPGMGSTVKMVHQLLAGVHICVAAEALNLAKCAGIDIQQMYAIVNSAAGSSWMFKDRGERMICNENNVIKSSLDIFVKDLDIVYSEAKALKCPIPIASAALQQYITGQSLGLGKQDDSCIIKVYENYNNNNNK